MPIPIIIGVAAAAAAAYGAKKGYDGYQKHSEADEIVKDAASRYEKKRKIFEDHDKKAQESLTKLGEFELKVGQDFQGFSTLADELLQTLNKNRQNKLVIQLPQHKLQKIEAYSYTAIGVLGSAAGAGVAGAAAGFAVYGGVMAFAAASTGTAISSLAGVAATNATLAAIGGGSLATGGLGIAGGTAILGAAVAAPVLAIAGWAYDNHGEEALKNAHKANKEVFEAIQKLEKAGIFLQTTEATAMKVMAALDEIYTRFSRYFDDLKNINSYINSLKSLGNDVDSELVKIEDRIMMFVNNGYALAAILTDLITTPIFKIKEADGKAITDKDGIPEMQKDADGSMILNDEVLNKSIDKAKEEAQPFFNA